MFYIWEKKYKVTIGKYDLGPKSYFRSTPMPDDFFGGKDDLTAALGYEENGVTTILFRKKIGGM